MIKFLLLILCTIYVSNAEVVPLDSSNFKTTLESSEYVLVKFFAPWCGHCKKMAPAYEQLSEEDLPNVVIAEVDATVESEYNVKGYPTLKWFVNTTENDFTGGRDFESMKAFIASETGEWATVIKNQEELDALLELEENTAVIVSNRDEETMRPLSKSLQSVVFAHLREDGESLLPDKTLRIYNNFDGELKYYDYSDEKSMERFLKGKSIPYINRLDSKSIKIAFEYSKHHILVFYDDENYENVKNQILPVAKALSPDYIFVTINSTNENVVSMFDVKTFPTAYLVDLTGNMKKYHLNDEVTSETIRKHIKDFEDGKLKPTLKSQDEPEQEDGKPYVLVGKTFSEVIKDKDVLVKFYAPWCGHCKKLAPIWDELASTMKDDDVVIAKYDATENEHEKVSIKGYPTIKFYKNGNPIDYSGSRDLDSLVSFVREHASTPQHKEL
jgi:protein disulfide-isomerase A1